MKPFFLLTITTTLLLTGCGESTQNTPSAKLFEPQREALDKAKGVEQTVNQQAAQQKQDVDHETE
ncbi:MAG: hypothetical protein A3B82_05440 [Methylophilales bacterium RIFCSPHIGHO2_02_FULL_57_10]|nr:MAG: hypothetical protein A3B82_05440 [Methylophilales bacterium RIFCSPHIGHO2_02_FULL_57_10]